MTIVVASTEFDLRIKLEILLTLTLTLTRTRTLTRTLTLTLNTKTSSNPNPNRNQGLRNKLVEGCSVLRTLSDRCQMGVGWVSDGCQMGIRLGMLSTVPDTGGGVRGLT